MKKELITLSIVAVMALPVTSYARDGRMDRADMLERFQAFDADQDGSVTKEEFEAHRSEKAAALDADGDGYLTAEELTTHFEANSQMRNARRVDRMIARADADGDGKLSAAEMLLGAGRSGRGAMLFERADADEDGVVTEEEFQTFVAERRHGRRGHGRRGDRRGWHD